MALIYEYRGQRYLQGDFYNGTMVAPLYNLNSLCINLIRPDPNCFIDLNSFMVGWLTFIRRNIGPNIELIIQYSFGQPSCSVWNFIEILLFKNKTKT